MRIVKSKSVDYALRLGLVCALAAGVLAYVYEATAERVRSNVAQERLGKVKELLPQTVSDIKEIEKDGVVFFRGTDINGKEEGVVVESAVKGYGGTINLLVGVSSEGMVSGVAVVSHSETPGLGSKAAEPDFLGQFKGRDTSGLVLKKDDPSDKDGIDAIAAATISSRAVVKGVKEALEKYEGVKDVR